MNGPEPEGPPFPLEQRRLISAVDLPIRLGFFLEREDVMFPFRPVFYRGVDRLPFIPTPEDEEELRASGKTKLLSLWQRYAEVTFTGELYASQSLATGLKTAFAEQGVGLEVIYAEVVKVPSSVTKELEPDVCERLRSRLRSLHTQVIAPHSGARMLGYDLSYPLPDFHSVLYQPGFQGEPETPRLDINTYGLFNNIEQLEQILPLANSISSSWRPFCGIGVYLVD